MLECGRNEFGFLVEAGLFLEVFIFGLFEFQKVADSGSNGTSRSQKKWREKQCVSQRHQERVIIAVRQMQVFRRSLT
jgi:hypothetical protein